MGDTKTRTEKKLSVIPKGHWRNKWRVHVRAIDVAANQSRGPGEHIATARYPSRELAEAFADKGLKLSKGKYPITYLGPVFFPDPTDP